jgi:elongation factor P hydroxylase
MSARELQEWQLFAQIEPFGEERADIQAALVAWTVATAAGAKNVRLDDFLLRFEPAGRQQSPQDMLMVVEMWNEALGGQDLRAEKAG